MEAVLGSAIEVWRERERALEEGRTRRVRHSRGMESLRLSQREKGRVEAGEGEGEGERREI